MPLPTLEEVHGTVQGVLADVANLKANDARHEAHIAKLNDAVTELREAFGRVEEKVATKDDLNAFAAESRARDLHNMQRAFDAIPAKAMVWLTAALVGVPLIQWLIQHFHG